MGSKDDCDAGQAICVDPSTGHDLCRIDLGNAERGNYVASTGILITFPTGSYKNGP